MMTLTNDDKAWIHDAIGEQLRPHGILLENLQSQVAVLAEAVVSLPTKADFEALGDRLGQRILVLESAVKENSRGIHKLDERVEKLDKRVDKLDRRVDKLDKRVGRLEGDVSAVRLDVERLCTEYAELRRASERDAHDHRAALKIFEARMNLEDRVSEIEKRIGLKKA